MAKKTQEELKQEAIGLGLSLRGDETYSELSELVRNGKVPDVSVEDLKAQSDAAAAALAGPKPEKTEQKMYSADEVRTMFEALRKELKKDDVAEEEDDGPRKHTCRMARIQNKFIVGLKDLNNDPFFPDRVLYSQDIFDEQKRVMVPHMTVIFEDGSDLTLPVETLFKIVKTITCPLIERKQKDASQKLGSVEVKELKGESYNPTATGEVITAKFKAVKETFVVKLPNREETVEVIPDVVNW